MIFNVDKGLEHIKYIKFDLEIGLYFIIISSNLLIRLIIRLIK